MDRDQHHLPGHRIRDRDHSSQQQEIIEQTPASIRISSIHLVKDRDRDHSSQQQEFIQQVVAWIGISIIHLVVGPVPGSQLPAARIY